MGEWKSLKIDSGTGWKSIYREAGTGWKSLTWEGVAIDVGGACINRDSSNSLANRTWIDKNNPANAGGTITNVCIYMYSEYTGSAYVGIFNFVSGTTYKCRSAANVGALAAGENNEVVSLSIVAGDMIGIYAGSSEIEKTSSGSGYMYSGVANHCVVDDETTYSTVATRKISLYGT